VNVPFLVAGAMALVGAGVHGVAGEMMIVRRLRSETLPSSLFGDGSATMVMIRVTWHLTTVSFFALGTALVACGALGSGPASRAVGLFAAGSYSAFAVLAIGTLLRHGPRALLRHGPRGLLGHPAPALFVTVATLAWLGTF
jgi:hypothetical protein